MAEFDLARWLVLATRPQAQNGRWIETLQSNGFRVADTPMMAIEPVSDPDGVQSIKNIIVDFDQFHKVIFVSQNAVEQTFNWLDQYWPQMPVGVDFFAVGEKTGQAVTDRNVSVRCGGVAMNSESLLSLPELNDVWGQRILICRGQGGRPLMGEVLHERGAFVHYLELYRRAVPAHAEEQLRAAISQMQPGAAVALVAPVFSGETLGHLDDLMARVGSEAKARMGLIVPGERVKQQALQLGYSQINVALNASSEAMLQALKAFCSVV